jgi:hypothetical protein
MNITDDSILFDLEFRGIGEFVAEISTGLQVPECFVARVRDIVQKEYDVELVTAHVSKKTRSGNFCLMPYTDQRRVTLVTA